MERTKLTDRLLRSLKPAADGKPREIMDQVGVRITGDEDGRAVLTLYLYTRYPEPGTRTLKKGATRRVLGTYVDNIIRDREPADDELLDLQRLTLADARRKAGLWLDLIARFADPADETERRKRARLENRKNTVQAIFDDWKRDKLSTERRGEESARDVQTEILPALGPKPIGEITDLDVLAIVNAKKRTAPAYARNLLTYCRRMIQWAIDQRVYGITRNPCDGLKPGKIIGRKFVVVEHTAA